MNITSTPISDLRNIEDETKDSKWIFRGQRNLGRTLKSSLERACEGFEGDLSRHGSQLEKILLREFQRRFHHYRSDVPNKESTLEWLAYMQHFGAPTRLLDWTYSLHVAAYFALEAPDPNGYAVWAIDQNWLQEKSFEIIKASHLYPKSKKARKRLERFLTGVPMEGDAVWFQTLLGDTNPPRTVFCANPFRLNERLTLQKGLFLAPGDVNASFESNLAELKPCSRHIKKFALPPERRSLLRQLDRLNISSATLFPGLEGFSRSLSVFHHRVSELS
jgi:hypothetical protein